MLGVSCYVIVWKLQQDRNRDGRIRDAHGAAHSNDVDTDHEFEHLRNADSGISTTGAG